MSRSPAASTLLTAKLAALNGDTVKKIVGAITRLKLDEHGQPFPYWDDLDVMRLEMLIGEALQRAANMTREDTLVQMVARAKLRRRHAPAATPTEDPGFDQAPTKPMGVNDAQPSGASAGSPTGGEHRAGERGAPQKS